MKLTAASRRKVGHPVILGINALSLVIGSYGCYYNIVMSDLPQPLRKAGPWQFLTNLSLAYSMVVFFIGFLAHLLKSQPLYTLKNVLHPIGLALESIVACIYWPLRLFFLHLLTSEKEFRLTIPVDLAIHLMPVASLMIDYLVFMPRWTLSTVGAFSLCTFLTGCYWVLLKNLVDVESGAIYPYAFMNVETETERAMIFTIVGAVAFTQFLLLRRLYDLLIDLKKDINKKSQ